ncbi:MAG: sodium:calcium antiporter [Gammaproteobacteria bacterium]|nr:sodium:calcium antiporter [Gammaproteobacteria bacterium]
MLTDILILFIGIVSILFLAEVIIRNAIDWARYYQLSGSFVGLTLLSIGTSIPELMTHLVGSVNILQRPEAINIISGLLIGTNIGSDIFQQNFILPVVGLVGTLIVMRRHLHAEVGAMTGAAVLTWFFCLGGQVTRLEGVMLLLAYAGYLLYLWKSPDFTIQHDDNAGQAKNNVILPSLIILVAFILMAVVTDQVVGAASRMVEQLPISASLFGVLILGIATSLPELSTALTSIYRGQKGISVGILVGSNITNPLFGIGLGAVISTYTVPDVVNFYDLPVNIATALLLYAFLWRKEGLTKKEALILILLFVMYLLFRQVFFPEDFP